MVPAVKAVTTPVLDTVATAVFEDAHGVDGCAVADPVKVAVVPTHALMVPLIVGNALTVKVAVVVQP